jgi:acetoin utilization deacetylase AcuC-like enzyme
MIAAISCVASPDSGSHALSVSALQIFYCDRMVAQTQSFSPSAAKPAKVVASWQRLGVPLELHEPPPVTPKQLSLAHDAAFVHEVLTCRRPNGFGNRSTEVAATLPFTSGAMLAAARHALTGRTVGVAPCSGFHHAGWSSAAGFCTFNGLMVTAAVLRAEGAGRIGILDCDQHYGNGTENIIRRLGAESWVHHITAGATFRTSEQVKPFFTQLERWLAEFADCDVVLYQAGADPHIDDPLGGWLTTEQLRERDARVFNGLQAAGVPVAWNLAGGYQRDAAGGISPVLKIHDNTLLECARVYAG